MTDALLGLILGYCLGSIPFGLLITRLAGTVDIRTIGSQNIGATNVLRTGRKDLAACANPQGDHLFAAPRKFPYFVVNSEKRPSKLQCKNLSPQEDLKPHTLQHSSAQ